MASSPASSAAEIVEELHGVFSSEPAFDATSNDHVPLEALLVDVRRALLTGPTPRRDFEAMLSRANKLA